MPDPTPHEPTKKSRAQVRAFTAYGVQQAEIARVMEIDPKTLRKHYRRELDCGQTEANAKVAESLFKKATGDGPQSVTAAIFWLKTRARWKDRISIVGDDDEPPVKVEHDFSGLSTEEKRQLRALLAKAGAK